MLPEFAPQDRRAVGAGGAPDLGPEMMSALARFGAAVVYLVPDASIYVTGDALVAGGRDTVW
jgi:hypothetical protein